MPLPICQKVTSSSGPFHYTCRLRLRARVPLLARLPLACFCPPANLPALFASLACLLPSFCPPDLPACFALVAYLACSLACSLAFACLLACLLRLAPCLPLTASEEALRDLCSSLSGNKKPITPCACPSGSDAYRHMAWHGRLAMIVFFRPR
eukprot:TRINITY_DN28076_c0_g1_i1.p1 TRINITY_DN28076_c0_g1~~TRINITY_DN28076_c0_g1_i1.p1  ORF type:complete len:152 (+),score=10.11 TRINITY_DN28076_c0_g1_i1:399-854(+)